MKSPITRLWLPALGLAAMTLAGCSSEESLPDGGAATPAAPHTYAMTLAGGLCDFGDPATRAAQDYTWPDGAKIYMQFYVAGERIPGLATYSLADDEWTVTADRALTPDGEAACEARHFRDATSQLSTTVAMTAQTAVFGDETATYTIEEDDKIAVKATLSPLTGRIRFTGAAGSAFAVTGLSIYSNYSLTNNSFTASTRKVSATLDAAGSSLAYHALFADSEARQLVFDGDGIGAWLRQFGAHVLAVGRSGHLRVPTADNSTGWTLVNRNNNEPITLATLADVTVDPIRSKSAKFAATVATTGNGTLLEVGFVYATSANVVADGTRVTCDAATSFSYRIAGLTPETAYYVAAYATNESGTAYSTVAAFRTISEAEDGTSLSRDEYGDDTDLNSGDTGSGSIDRTGYGDDTDLNSSGTSSGSIDRTGYGDDTDLNSSGTSSGSIGSTGYGNDTDLNGGGTSSGSIGSTGYGDDTDLNNGGTSSVGIGRTGYDNDENWN